MGCLRRVLGIFVMIAGVLGLVLSIAGMAGLWFMRPMVVTSVNTTVATLTSTIDTSQQAMVVTGQALGATVESVNALSDMLGTTAESINATQPVLDQLNGVIGDKLPSTLKAATDSLTAAQAAATSMEDAMHSLDTFRMVMSGVPGVGGFLPVSEPYNPEKPLADSLGELAVSLEDMPATFTEMAANMDTADDNLGEIEANLNTMSGSVAMISQSLGEYEAMVGQSRASMDDLKLMLTNIQNNLTNIMNTASLVLGLFFLWMLAIQVVVLSQGWELFNGTASRMESGEPEPVKVEAE